LENVLNLLASDLFAIGTGLNFLDLVLPLGLLFWLIILFIPIAQTDHRDVVCGLTYVIFLTAVGIILTLAIPRTFSVDVETSNQCLLVFLMVSASAFRWFWRSEKDLQNAKFDKLIEKNGG